MKTVPNRVPQQTVALLFILHFYPFLGSSILFAQVPRDFDTVGQLSVRSDRSSQFYFEYQSFGVDAQTKTVPPDTVYLDRRVVNHLQFNSDFMMTSRFGLRLGGAGLHYLQKTEEEEPPRSPQTTHYSETTLHTDLIYITPKDLELVLGNEYHAYLPVTTDRASTVVSSTIRQNAASYSCLRAALVRRGSGFSGSFYYVSSNESKRDFRTTASDGTMSTGSTTVFTPNQYGISTWFELASHEFEGDLAMIQASGLGPRTSIGNTLYDDHLRIKISHYKDFGGLGLRTDLQHTTLSYSSNAFASLESIPISRIKLSIIFGETRSHFKVGVTYDQGEDGMSITEFNAKFNYSAFGLLIGGFIPL